MGGLCSCRGRESQVNAGSILDRVISQASNQDQCLLYRLANYKKGGELIEAYNAGGQVEVEKVVREQFSVLMYADGKGQVINRAEYLRWKFRDLEEVVLPIEASLSRFDPLAQWKDHDACWQMQYRGSLGETLLHVLIICDTRVHTRIARILLKCFPKLAIDVVEGEEYLGASALHLAIAYNNNELVQDLVEAGATVSQRATGSFFLPRDQQRMNPARTTDYEGLAYLGEYPLAWAACCANESVYNLLLDSGAHPDERDSFGNMILHMVVVCDKLDMFGYALRHPKLPARNGIANSAGLTPLTLACQLGRAEVFREMLELSAKEFWRYSNITCSAYPLNALDTLLPDGRTNWNSALFIILNGTKEEHLDMLDGGIIQRLLEEKWKTFARLQFLKRLVILVFHLVSLSLAVYLRPGDADSELLAWPEDPTDVARTIAEAMTVLGVLSYILIQLGGEVVNIGLLSFLRQLSHEPAKFIFLASNLLILACIPYRLAENRHAEDAILVVAVPGSWFLLMFFAGAVRLTGPFVTMVYSMITGDMLTFGMIYTVVLFGFSQSFYFLYKGFPGVKSSLYSSYPSTWMALFQITLGDYNYPELSFTTYPNLSKTVFAIFMVLVPILLLNMLIAMMGNTYAHVIEQSEKEWVKQWAKIVVSLERAVSQKDAHNYLQEYSIKLGPGDDPNNPASEQRGVMVIKSKSKTRAKQRKGAVANWKHVGKVTINELRKRGMTGEELRFIMWGRTSFSTPVRVPPSAAVEPSEVTALTGGFGDALTAALDVMAFAHDLDITTATQGIPTTANPLAPSKVSKTHLQPQPPIQQQPQVTQKPAQAPGKAPGISELIEKKPIIGANSERKPFITETLAGELFGVRLEDKDVRNLKLPDVTENPDPLLDLVITAENPSCDDATLLNIAKTAQFISEAGDAAAALQHAHQRRSITKLLPSTFTAKKQFLIESSDNDIHGDNALLGAETRLRRIRSASSRLASSRKYSYRGDDDSSSSSPSADLNAGYRRLMDEPEDRFNSRENETVKISTPPKTETLTNLAANGHGTTSKAAGKHRSVKTAKNRVAPKEVDRSVKRREKSAGPEPATASPESTPDPLEPWSTRGITDMNTILAWKENAPESP
ncbi:uncharacterized protein LOC105692131 isoform X2 [Athalia rosae]|uniref:uncharacterized protein LOC105692131 isoform X2 n=1 Tax=Athalia rosae TaxID=37344 RepID=UPI0020335B77|nr:uncharacterized protein LOC105692131 isoform X2 [Athalia rosae]